jgi:hypothetical protein
MGRFTAGEGAVHHTQWPLVNYTWHLFVWTLPWTVLLGFIVAEKEVRLACKEDPALLWLFCWSLGGLIFMECIPSKRFDRILPVVPPMCLLLAASARYLPRFKVRGEPIGRLAILVPLVAVPLAAGYTGWKVIKGFGNDARALVTFGERAQLAMEGHLDRLAVVNGKDEGMLMYVHAQRFTRLDEALTMWRFKRIDWLVLGDDDFTKHRSALEPLEVVVSTPPLPEKYNSYHLVRRVEPLPQASRVTANPGDQITPLSPGLPPSSTPKPGEPPTESAKKL